MSKPTATIEAEKRAYQQPFTLEQRAEGDVTKNFIVGYAFKFNSTSKVMGWGFRETIDPGALEGCDLSDVICRAFHDDKFMLGRTSNDTLKLIPDAVGLRYECELPNTQSAKDVLELINRGDISESSFEFWIKADSWGLDADGMELRTILKFQRITDVAPVPRPAYLDTTVAQRSHQLFSKPGDGDSCKHARIEIAKRILSTI